MTGLEFLVFVSSTLEYLFPDYVIGEDEVSTTVLGLMASWSISRVLYSLFSTKPQHYLIIRFARIVSREVIIYGKHIN